MLSKYRYIAKGCLDLGDRKVLAAVQRLSDAQIRGDLRQEDTDETSNS